VGLGEDPANKRHATARKSRDAPPKPTGHRFRRLRRFFKQNQTMKDGSPGTIEFRPFECRDCPFYFIDVFIQGGDFVRRSEGDREWDGREREPEGLRLSLIHI